MNCRELRDQLGRNRSSKRPTTAGRRRVCAWLLTGWAILAGAAGVSVAASSNTGASDGTQSGIRDPMNPQAYMQDLAARMNGADRNVFLHGIGESKAAPAPVKKTATPPAKTNPPTPSPASQPATAPVPALSAPAASVPQTQTTMPGTGSGSPPALTSGTGNAAPTSNSALTTASPNTTDRTPSLSSTLLPGQTSAGAAQVATQSQPAEPPVLAPAVSVAPAVSPSLEETKPSAGNAPAAVSPRAALTRMEPGMAPINTAQSSATAAMTRGPGSVEKELQVARTGLTLWNEPELAKAAAQEEARGNR